MSSQPWDRSSRSPPYPSSHSLSGSGSHSLGSTYSHQLLSFVPFDSNDNSGLNDSYPCYLATNNPYHSREPYPAAHCHAMTMPSYRNMDTAALVAAAIGSPEKSVSRNSPLSPQPVLAIRKPTDETLASSPLTELSDHKNEPRNRRSSVKAQSTTQNRRRRSQASDDDEDYVNNTRNIADTKRPRTRRSYKRKSCLIKNRDSDKEVVTDPASTSTFTTKVTSSKKRLIRKKPTGTRVPQSLDEAGPADRMMWEWKNMGKGWEDIRTEWQRLAGWRPGQSSLSVRYIKLNENFARNGAAGDHELLRFKKEAEEELLSHLWDRVAEKMLAHSPMSEHNPRDLKRRYDLIVRTNFDLAEAAQEDGVNFSKQEEEKEDADGRAVTKVEDNNDMEFTEADQAVDTVLTPHSPAAVKAGEQYAAAVDSYNTECQGLSEEPQRRSNMCRHSDGTNEHESLYDSTPSHANSIRELTWDTRPPARAERSMNSRIQTLTSDFTAVPSSPDGHMASSPLFKSLMTYDPESD